MLFSKYHLITSTNKGGKFSLHVANVCHEKWQPNHSRDDMFETILTAKNTDHNSLSIRTQWHTWTDEPVSCNMFNTRKNPGWGAPLQWSWSVGSAVLTPLFQGTGKKYRILTPLFREHRILTKGSTRKKENFDPHILAFIEFWPSQLLLHRMLTPIFQWLIEYWPPFLWPHIDFDPYFLALRQHIEFWPPFFGAHRLLSPWVPGSLPTTFNEGVPPPPRGKTCQQVYSRGHRQDIVWLKLCTSISMFIVHQSVWNICTHTAYNVHKTHNKSLSSRDVNSSGGGESPCLSSWSMTLQMRVGIPACARYNSQWRSGRLPGDSLATSRGCRLPIGRIYHCCASLAQISNHIYRPINHTIKAHTLIKDMQYWQFILVNTLANSEARFKHSTKYNVSSPYHAGSWHCRQQLPWQPDPRARGFDDSSFPGPGKYMDWTHV